MVSRRDWGVFGELAEVNIYETHIENAALTKVPGECLE